MRPWDSSPSSQSWFGSAGNRNFHLGTSPQAYCQGMCFLPGTESGLASPSSVLVGWSRSDPQPWPLDPESKGLCSGISTPLSGLACMTLNSISPGSVRRHQGTSASEFDEESVMERVVGGDVSAFEMLVERFWRQLKMYALQLTKDQDLADDIAQEALARLWRSRDTWVSSRSVRLWLLRTARHSYVTHYRKGVVRERWALSPESGDVLPVPTPLLQTERAELRAAIRDAVARLSPRRREAFTLVHVQGLSYREAAEVMEVREQTVANYLQAALSDLRDILRKHGPSDV